MVDGEESVCLTTPTVRKQGTGEGDAKTPNVYGMIKLKPIGATNEKIIEAELADDIMFNHVFLTAMDTDDLYMYHPDGIYRPGAETIVKALIKKDHHHISPHQAEAVIFHIKSSTYVPRSTFDADIKLIPLQNGVWNLDTNEIKEYSPLQVFTYKLPIKYDPKADCPAFKVFMSQVLKPDDVLVIQELFGYCLWRRYQIQKAIMFVGSGANGKSVCLNVLKTFLGPENISTVELQALDENRFAPAALYQKFANIYADLPTQALKQTGQFKILTGEDTVMAEQKFKDMFSFVNYAKLIFSANKLPEAHDDTDAYFRRWIILIFPHKFEGVAADKNLFLKLTIPEEISGIFNWAIEGLKRLLANGDFSHSKSTDEIRDNYERLSSPLHSFIKDCVDVDPDSYVTKEKFYSAFVKYCEDNSLPALAKNVVGADVPRYVAAVRSQKMHMRDDLGKKIRKDAWVGLRLNKYDDIHGESGKAPIAEMSMNDKAMLIMQSFSTYAGATMEEVNTYCAWRNIKPEEIATFVTRWLSEGKIVKNGERYKAVEKVEVPEARGEERPEVEEEGPEDEDDH